MAALVPPHIERLAPYVPGKPVEELERELGVRDAVKLASNENPVGPSPRVLEAVRAALTTLHRYPDASAYALRTDLAAHHRVRFEEVCVGNGSNELIDLLCRTFAGPDDHAVFGDPSFVCYALGCTAANVPFTRVPLTDHLAWDVEALRAAVRPTTKLLFLANPNNPTGAHVGRDALARLLADVPRSVLPIVDEAYVEFADAPDYVTALELRTLHPRLVVLRTFSKAYGLAGLRVGYAIAPAEVVGYLERVRAPFNVNALAQVAARAALRDPEHLRAYVELNARERARLRGLLTARGLRVAPSQTNFLLVGFARPGAEVYAQLLREGVIARVMPPPLSTHLRITVGLPPENDRLVAALDRIGVAG